MPKDAGLYFVTDQTLKDLYDERVKLLKSMQILQSVKMIRSWKTMIESVLVATVKNVIPKHLEATTAKLIEIGCEVEEFDDAVRVVSSKPLHHTQVTTLPYPGFPTDMQPQMSVLALAEGTSTVTESILENFIYF